MLMPPSPILGKKKRTRKKRGKPGYRAEANAVTFGIGQAVLHLRGFRMRKNYQGMFRSRAGNES
jgi:hypothetical protein